ncbi:hypothetical protein VTK56DRAFT_6439 [Thermocarpiscus australiensis]
MSKSHPRPPSSTSIANGKPSADPVTGRSPPPPPLSPPLASARHAHSGPVAPRSDFLEKLASMPESYLLERPQPPPYAYKPVYYFFYGTLMNPNILKHVLDLKIKPVLRPGKVYGYELAKWGDYHALIDSEPGRVVTGCAYLVQSVEEEYKLAYYETNAYSLEHCKIYFTDGPDGREDDEPAFGRTFMYAGDAQALKHGRFDRALWELQMGTRLPPEWRRGAKRDEQKNGAHQSQAEQSDKGAKYENEDEV